MKAKNYELMLDIYKGILNPQNIQFATEDFGMCSLTFSILEDMITPYRLDDCIVRMLINGQQQDCTIIDATNGKVTITLLQSMLKEGQNVAELQIYDALNQTLRITTPTFNYNVRRSLMNDTIVEADPNYSILQNMILEVSNANEVANNAKVTAEGALATANQAATTIEGEIAKVDKAVLDANTALDRATNVVTQTELEAKATELEASATTKVNNKIGINSVFDPTNFNFIENKVEQDGLVYYGENITDKVILQTITESYIKIKFKVDDLASIKFICGNRSSDSTTGFYLSCFQNKNLSLTTTKDNIIKTIDVGKEYVIDLFITGKTIKVVCDGVQTIVNDYIPNTNGKFTLMAVRDTNTKTEGLKISYISVYNRILAPQEIQHSLFVLNNAPSINALDAGGKKLLLSTDTDHVQDRTGRTQEEINRTFYKRSCKEFTADTSGKITVPNGEKGYVLSAEIKGQTVKNVITKSQLKPFNVDGIVTPYMSFTSYFGQDAFPIESNKTYTVVMNISRFVKSESYLRVVCKTSTGEIVYPSERIVPNGLGVYKLTFTAPSNASTVNALSSGSTNDKYDFECNNLMIVEGNGNNVNSFFTGLSSTQAVINVNGASYPLYEPTIVGKTRILDADTGLVPTDPTLPALKDGDVLDLATRTITFADASTQVLSEEEVKAYRTHRKVILLGGLPNAKNTLEILENGSGIYVENTIQSLINESSTPILRATGENTQLFEIIVKNQADVNWNTFGYINDRLPQITATNMAASDIECFSMAKTTQFGDGFLIRVLKSNLQTQDIAGFKAWLKANPITVRYQLATPIVTTIDKSIMPTIQTADKINICGVESPVAPSSFKLTLPVDINGEQNAAISSLQTAVALLQQQVLTLQAFHK